MSWLMRIFQPDYVKWHEQSIREHEQRRAEFYQDMKKMEQEKNSQKTPQADVKAYPMALFIGDKKVADVIPAPQKGEVPPLEFKQSAGWTIVDEIRLQIDDCKTELMRLEKELKRHLAMKSKK